jgi:ADP-ribose pyrophosphatase YjhB (NUDIX family)
MNGVIRVKAIAIVRRGETVLLSFAIDPDTGRRYGRFLGGGVEPGERAEDALRREWREELGLELAGVEARGVVENIFEHGGRIHHEVIFVFRAALAERSLYDRSTFAVNEAVCDGPAEWVAVDALRRCEIAVYPPELLDLL